MFCGATGFVLLYAGEGHHFHDPAHVADLTQRIVAWFDTYLRPAGAGAAGRAP